MKKYLVIGNPIEHSLSPKLHNHWIKENNIDAIYDKKQLNENNVEGTNGDSAINDTLCGGSAVNGNWGWLPESAFLIGFLLLLAGHFGARRTLRRFLGR